MELPLKIWDFHHRCCHPRLRFFWPLIALLIPFLRWGIFVFGLLLFSFVLRTTSTVISSLRPQVVVPMELAVHQSATAVFGPLHHRLSVIASQLLDQLFFFEVLQRASNCCPPSPKPVERNDLAY